MTDLTSSDARLELRAVEAPGDWPEDDAARRWVARSPRGYFARWCWLLRALKSVEVRSSTFGSVPILSM